MDSWVPLFTPEPGTIIKDMDVVGNHCVLVAKTPADDFILIVFPLSSPKEVHTVQVSFTGAFVSLLPDLLVINKKLDINVVSADIMSLASPLGLFHQCQEARRGRTRKRV